MTYRYSVVALALAGASVVAIAAVPPQGSAAQSSEVRQVVALLKSIETGDTAAIAAINPNKYTQHNLAAADGLAGFGALMQQLPKGSAKVNTRRVFQDGNFVVTHTEYNFFGPKIGFDIFRFENGKIVEHWDNLQETATAPNRSGRTQTDGPIAVTDLAATQANKALVRRFLNDAFVTPNPDKLADYFDGTKYAQHSAGASDDWTMLKRLAAVPAGQQPMLKFDKIHTVLGEGSFVLAVSEGTFMGRHSAFYDLFRVESGKIAEHWDTIETIPPQSEWKNQNGKFGF